MTTPPLHHVSGRRVSVRPWATAAALALVLMAVVAGTAQAAVGSWTTVALPGTPGAVEALVVDPVSPTTVYVSTSAGGIVKSMDGGAS